MNDHRLHQYELVYVLQPELDDEGIKALGERINQVVERHGGSILSTEPWGRRQLAYPIKKFMEGYYVLHHVAMLPEGTDEVERVLRLSEDVLRYLLIRKDKK